MFLEVKLTWNVIIPPEQLGARGVMLQKAIIVRLMDMFSSKPPCKDYGHFLAVTTIDSIGQGIVRHTGEVLFPVVFNCITLKFFTGEVLEGKVLRVGKLGVFLEAGTADRIYLSSHLMPGYEYFRGDSSFLMLRNQARIAKDSKVRVVVIGTQWLEEDHKFNVLVSLEGDYLGPMN